MLKCKIEDITDKFLILKPLAEDEIVKCKSCKGCGIFKKKLDTESNIKIGNIADIAKYNIGDIVNIDFDGKIYLKLTLLFLLLPILIFSGILIVGEFLDANDFINFFCAAIAVFIYYYLLKSKLNCEIYKIAE
ncbi:MAG TPA: SoxR reducing system RseC family protein [bacterium]|nr:SoxR reducing system RseC family protein [bacterium]